MSTPPPDRPDQPTQPLRAPSEPPRVREREVERPADDHLLFELDDRMRSLRTAVVLLGVVALAALAVAAYALLREEDERGGGDGQRVSRLDDRVDDLREDVERLEQRGAQSGELEEALADKADAEDVAALEEALGELQQQSGESGEPAPETVQAIEDIGQRLDQLEQQVQEQEQQQP